MENILPLNYIGSKKTLIDTLDIIFSKYLNESSVFGDLCSGTGIVSQFVKYKYGCNIISNDLQEYSKIITEAKLNSYSAEEINEISKCYKHLNDMKLINGFFYENYKDKYFTSENCKKIDTIRQGIEELKISDKIKTFILASLISTADKSSNCSGVYGAYLKQIKKSATKKIVLDILPSENNKKLKSKHKCFRGDIFDEQITNISYDVIYIDPPYNNRQYGSNYHILETIAKYDNPIIKGKTGLREYEKSGFCYKYKIKSMFTKIRDKLKFKVLIISYSSDGILPILELTDIFINKFKVILYEKEYKKFKSQSTQKNENIREYIVVVEQCENIDYSIECNML